MSPEPPDTDGRLIADMEALLQEWKGKRTEAEEQIARYETAIAALKGATVSWGHKRSSTAGRAILAALASFKAPISTQTLLDHPELSHYSRQTLRGALSELNRTGQVHAVERTPHGFIWSPDVNERDQ